MDWRPGHLDLGVQRQALDARLFGAIDSRLLHAGDTGSRHLLAQIRDARGGRSHPYVAQVAYWLQEKLSVGPNAVVRLTHARRLLVDLVSHNLHTKAFGSWDDKAGPEIVWATAFDLTVSRRACANLDDAQLAPRSFAFNTIPDPVWQETVAEALDLLGRIDPEMSGEVLEAVDIVCSFSCDDAISFSDVQAFGAIFVRDKFAGTATALAEILVHEASHSVLNVIAASTPLFTNPATERYQTPLRKDPRPMFGLFHQLFVLKRLERFHLRLGQNFEGIDGSLDTIRENIELAESSIAQYGMLTATGRRLVASYANA
jgi:HEXXH motif-containing protein